MKRCLQLAAMGAGHVAPNPMVGAVLVNAGRIIGEGFHAQFGGPHAEVNCINSVKESETVLISESILYVSLEPCSHFGKTPPCADLIIKNRIPHVVIACRDISAEVNGKGLEQLEAAGVKITLGVLEEEALELNRRFFSFHRYQRPYIILKWAQSMDKKIATGPMPEDSPPSGATKKRLVISNGFTDHLVHKWRSEEAAILVGSKTALYDDPALTARLWPGKDPLRLVIDTDLKLPATLQLFDRRAKTMVFNEQQHVPGEMLFYYKVDKGEEALQQIMTALYREKINSVMVEGGATLLQSFIDKGLWDEARVITNEKLWIGNGIEAPVLKNADFLRKEQLFNDSMVYYTKEKQ